MVTVYKTDINGKCLVPLYVNGLDAVKERINCNITTIPDSQLFSIEDDNSHANSGRFCPSIVSISFKRVDF